MSFNSIEKLEGLSKLTKLRDLSVHHNSIQCIENLDELKDLEVLSIGDNLLPSLEDAPIVYLRRFRRLRCLNLAGNPLCEDAEYEAFVVAHLPDLKFLDYRRVAEDTVSVVCECVCVSVCCVCVFVCLYVCMFVVCV